MHPVQAAAAVAATSELYVPTGHTGHMLAPALPRAKLPAVHVVHTAEEFAPAIELCVPGGHSVHDDAAGEAANEPAPQAVQEEAAGRAL